MQWWHFLYGYNNGSRSVGVWVLPKGVNKKLMSSKGARV